MRALERDTHVIPVTLLANHRKLIAILEIAALAAAIARRQPVDVSSDGFRRRAMDDDADVFAGFAAAQVQLVAVTKRDAAVERAGFILAQIRLVLSELGCALRPRFGEHEIELEFDVFVFVDRGQAGASLTFRRRRARDHAVFNLPPALCRIG